MKERNRLRNLLMVALLAGGILSFGSENNSYAQDGRGSSTGRGSKITESSNSKTRSGESTDYNLLVKDLSGKEISLSQFKGKVIFLTFWATYCGFCRGELPSIQRLWQSVGHRDDIAFLLVSKDGDSELVKKFLSKNAYDFPVFMRIKGQSAKAFSGQNLPVTYVIDKSGKILLHSTGDTKKEKFSMSEFLLETANKKGINVFGLPVGHKD